MTKKEAVAEKMKKITATTGGLPGERSEKGGGRRKVERKGQQQGGMEESNESSLRRSDE